MSTASNATNPATWSLDREIVLARVIDAPPQAVFDAWVAADRFCEWFGPDGFTCEVREMDVRPGGRARFDMVSPDGTTYTNRFEYLEVVAGARLVMDIRTSTTTPPASG
jgi:uncharacterized protein YndB with AHSA1/START domain